MLKVKIVSSLDKVMADGRYCDYAEISRVSVLRGEKVSVEAVLELSLREEGNFARKFVPTLGGSLADYASIREVRHVPALMNGRALVDDDYMTTKPCLMPDILMPLTYGGSVVVSPFRLVSLWIDIDIPEDFTNVGVGDLTLTLEMVRKVNDVPECKVTAGVEVDVIDAVLPKQELLFTQWFHSDCLANYYGVEKWSDEHFAICEKFATTACKNGINMLYTPLISPPLDNEYDTRDLQLAKVTVTDGKYSFSWENLERWIDMCNRVGIRFFEIGHLFTQGGAAYATKVMGNVDGEYVRLFAKDTPCDAPEYTGFLRAMLSSFLAFMKARGDDKRCYFHISDEPNEAQLETYNKAKQTVADLLDGYVVMDALSHYEFYERGVVKKPVVILNHLAEFLEHDVPGLWTYNCCAPDKGFSNRFLAMTLSRNRSICLLLYKYNIEGFLHWGYNFYNNSGSSDCINPFLETDSGGIFPSGDAFSVYPGVGGEPLESMRLVTFREAIDDLRAFKLCEKLYSRETVISVLEEMVGGEIKTNTYINDSKAMMNLRERINAMIKDKA